MDKTIERKQEMSLPPLAPHSMNNGHWLWKAIGTIGLILTLGVSMNAQAGFFGLFGGGEKWKEEVRLSDGRVIVVDRELISEGGGDEWASNRSGSKPKEYRIRFFHPDRAQEKIEWRSTKIDSQTWPEIPLVFDIESEKPVVYSIVAISNGCSVYSKYIYGNGSWIEDQLPEQFQKRTTNLLFGSHKDMPAFVNFEEKRIRNNYIGVRNKYLQIGPLQKICG